MFCEREKAKVLIITQQNDKPIQVYEYKCESTQGPTLIQCPSLSLNLNLNLKTQVSLQKSHSHLQYLCTCVSDLVCGT